jgi:hypothetical protein
MCVYVNILYKVFFVIFDLFMCKTKCYRLWFTKGGRVSDVTSGGFSTALSYRPTGWSRRGYTTREDMEEMGEPAVHNPTLE